MGTAGRTAMKRKIAVRMIYELSFLINKQTYTGLKAHYQPSCYNLGCFEECFEECFGGVLGASKLPTLKH